MKLRNEIAIWVASSGFMVSLVLSMIVFFEMIEQPYITLDSELKYMAKIVGQKMLASTLVKNDDVLLQLDNMSKAYWIKIFDNVGNCIYQSNIAKNIELPGLVKRKGTTIFAQSNQSDKIFRARVIKVRIDNSNCVVHIAKSIDELYGEIFDLVWILIFALLMVWILLAILSYIAAGKIMIPIDNIRKFVMNINEANLYPRLQIATSKNEIDEMSVAINRMLDRLEFSYQKQKDFIANVSHEMKTPIAILKLFFEESIQNIVASPDYQVELHKKLIILQRLEHIVKNILELARLEAKDKVEFEVIDLHDLIRSLLEDFAPLVNSKKLCVKHQMMQDIMIKGNSSLIARLLINLFENAVKYSFDGGEISVELNKTVAEFPASAGKVEAVRLSVFNTGLGITSCEAASIFEPFYRSEKARSSGDSGYGLGLSIVREIVRLHNGIISVEGEDGKWSRFDVLLPVLQADR